MARQRRRTAPIIPSRELREKFPHLADGRGQLLSGFAGGVRPRKRRSIDVWARDERYVAPESGSPFALEGKVRWDNDNSPHLVEVMQCLSLDHPSFRVTLKGSAQIAKSEAGINLIGQIIDEDPSPILVLLPSLDEAVKYATIKLGPSIDASPALAAKVREQKERDRAGSTISRKRFRGGYAIIAPASTTKPLQMVSYRIIIAEEVTEYPADVGGRGHPLDQALARAMTYRDIGAKVYTPSTPGLKGHCRITTDYEAGDQRMRYVPCPHCGAYQRLEFRNLKWDRETKPFGAHFRCARKGCRIDFKHQPWMISNDRAVWLKCYPRQEHDEDGVVDGDIGPPGDWIAPEQLPAFLARDSGSREPSFFIWQAYATTAKWDLIVERFLDIKGDAAKEKTFFQQWLGEAYEEKGDAPDAEKLTALVETFPLRELPAGALFTTGFCDVQAAELKWCVYAWGRGMEHWRIDGGAIEGNPTDDAVWAQLSQVVRQHYLDPHGQAWGIDAFGVDTGYLSHRVYKFVADMKRIGFEKCFATDGRGGVGNAQHPPIGTPKNVSINWRGQKQGKVKLWPIGTWPMKLECYGALARLLRSAVEPKDPNGEPWSGLPHFGTDCDLPFFQELTAEYLHVADVKGKPVREWRKIRTNDRLDCYVGARALASHVIGEAGMRHGDWEVLAAMRQPRPVQGDLLTLPYRIRVETSPAVPAPSPDAADGPSLPLPPVPPAPVSAAATNTVRGPIRSNYVRGRR